MADNSDDMYSAVGQMLAGWNSLEWSLVELIGEISQAARTTDILTAHMSSPAICNGLRALAVQRLPPDLSDHIFHAVDVFERLRDYRNQFVHRVTAVLGQGPDASAFTYGLRVNSKGELLVDQGNLHRSELDTMMAASSELSGYLVYLGLHVKWSFNKKDDPPRAFRHWPPEKIAMPPALKSRWQRDVDRDEGSPWA